MAKITSTDDKTVITGTDVREVTCTRSQVRDWLDGEIDIDDLTTAMDLAQAEAEDADSVIVIIVKADEAGEAA